MALSDLMTSTPHAWTIELLILDRSETKQVSTLMAEMETLIGDITPHYTGRVQKIVRMYLDEEDERELEEELQASTYETEGRNS